MKKWTLRLTANFGTDALYDGDGVMELGCLSGFEALIGSAKAALEPARDAWENDDHPPGDPDEAPEEVDLELTISPRPSKQATALDASLDVDTRLNEDETPTLDDVTIYLTANGYSEELPTRLLKPVNEHVPLLKLPLLEDSKALTVFVSARLL
jgi:hypothetical protein